MNPNVPDGSNRTMELQLYGIIAIARIILMSRSPVLIYSHSLNPDPL